MTLLNFDIAVKTIFILLPKWPESIYEEYDSERYIMHMTWYKTLPDCVISAIEEKTWGCVKKTGGALRRFKRK